MTITRTQLEQIIREETYALIAEKKLEQDGPGNPYRDEDGEYSSYTDSRSWSHKGRKAKMKSGSDAAPCGRGERRKCKDGELKWESDKPPRSDSTSKYRRDDPRYENERMKRSRLYPGYEEMARLANGIMEIIDEAYEEPLEERRKGKSKQSRPRCLTTKEVGQLRAQVYQQLMAVIRDYESSKKAKASS